MDRRRALGGRRHLPPARSDTLRAAAQWGGPALSLHQRGGDHQTGLSSGRHDPRRESAARPGPRRPWTVHGGRAVLERVRRRRWDWEIVDGTDHGGRQRARPLRLSPLALRPGPPRPSLRGGASQRDLPLLLLPSLSVRRRRVGPAAADERPTPPDARPWRGLWTKTWLGTARALRAGPAMAPCRRRPAALRLDPAAMVRAAGRGASRIPRTRGDHRHDLVRENR